MLSKSIEYLKKNCGLYKNHQFSVIKTTKKKIDFVCLSQRSVSTSIAVGLFCGLLPAPFQMVSATAIAYYLNANIPIAIFTTLYTNPITVIPIYIVCLKVGLIFLNYFSNSKESTFISIKQEDDTSVVELVNQVPDFNLQNPMNYIEELLMWLFSIGWPLLIGTLIVAIALSIVGYGVTNLVWTLRKRIKLRI